MNIHQILSAINVDQDSLNVPKSELNNTSVQNGIGIFFGIAAAVAVLIIVISSIKMIISRGNPQDFVKARDSVIYSVVGLVISMTALAIVTFVVESV